MDNFVTVVQGNDFTLNIALSTPNKETQATDPYDIRDAKSLEVKLISQINGHVLCLDPFKIVGKNVISTLVSGTKLKLTDYDVEVSFVKGGLNKRAYECNIIHVVRCQGDTDYSTQNTEGENGYGIDLTMGIDIEVVNLGKNVNGSGTLDYNDLEHKPSINDVVLEGNKTLEDLGMYSKQETDEKFETKSHAADTFETKESAAEADKRVQGMLDGKVDKEPGKGLSTNDLTDERAGKVDKLKIDGRANEYLNGAGIYSRPVRQGYGVSLSEDNTVSVDPQVIARQSDVANVAADLAAQKAKEQGDIDRANAAISKEETDRKAAVASLQSLIDILNSGYQFMGVATPETNPGTPDQKVFYIANGKGTYPTFGGIEVSEDEVVILYYDTVWHKLLTGIASQEKLSELEGEITEVIGGEREIYNSDFGQNQRSIITPIDIPNGAKFIVKLLENNSTSKNLRFAFSNGTQNYPNKVWHVTGIGSEVEVINDLGFDVHYVEFYNEGTDGYLAWNTNIRITVYQDGKLTQLTKEVDIIKDELSKPKIAISYSGTTSAPAMFCNITKSNCVKLEGTGSKTITASIASAVTARCMSIGFKIPYTTQDVAQVSIDGCVFTKAKADSRTASGKAYFVEGDHFHRLNFKANNLESFNIAVTADDNVSWEIYLSTEAVLNDDMPLIPITIGYDLGFDYKATFPYEGENITIYELHKRLNIPYYVALTTGVIIDNEEISEAIECGLAEVIYYSGGAAVSEWKKTDGSLANTYRLAKNAVGSACNFVATSQNIMDRNIFVNLKNAGLEVIRQNFGDKARFGRLSQKYGDGDVFYCSCVGMGMTYPVWDVPFNLPMVYYGHGIGTPIDPDDPYKANYVDPTGSQTIDFMTNVLNLMSQGKIAAMKPSEWLAYCKKMD